jgi:hypothetical protein
MLFPRNALVSGPQVCFSTEQRIAKAGANFPQSLTKRGMSGNLIVNLASPFPNLRD